MHRIVTNLVLIYYTVPELVFWGERDRHIALRVYRAVQGCTVVDRLLSHTALHFNCPAVFLLYVS